MPLATPTFRRGAGLARRWPLIFQARELTIDALTDQPGSLVRAATASIADSNGTNRNVGYHQPAWTAVGGVSALQLGASEYLAYDCDLKPVACCGLLDFFENGTISAGTIFDITNTTPSTPYIRLYSTGGQYRIEHHNGSAAVTATMTGTAPTSGQRVRLRWWVYSTGAVQIWQSINGAAETGPAASSANAFGAAWASPTKYYLNSAGLGNYGAMKLVGAVFGIGNQSQADLLKALA